MTQSLALSSSTQNSEKLNQAGFNFPPPPPELSFQFTYSSMCQLRSTCSNAGKYSSNHREQTVKIDACIFRHRFLGMNDYTITFSGSNCPPICPREGDLWEVRIFETFPGRDEHTLAAKIP